MPTISTPSASAISSLLCGPNMWPVWPRRSGCDAAMFTSEESTSYTSAPSISATRASSACAPESATPSPISTTGRAAAASSSAARPTEAGEGEVSVSGTVAGSTGSEFSSSSTSIGSATNTGPRGGVRAILTARRMVRSTERGSVTRVAYFVTGLAIATRSDAIWASMAS